MRYLIFLLFPSMCFAKDFHFIYIMPDGQYEQKLEYKTKADTWKEALARGADFCVNFFVDKKPATEEAKLEIVDVCTNPIEQ